MSDLVAAYSETGAAWQAGPGPIYDRLAEAVVARTPLPLAGRLILEVGAGTGSASRAISSTGGVPVGVDPALGMLVVDRGARPPATAADAAALPVRSRAAGGFVAAFSLNHLPDPADGLREAVRVTQRGGPIVVSSYAAADTHPVKDAVTAALVARGRREPGWYARIRAEGVSLLATPGGCSAAAQAAELDGHVDHVHVPFPELDAPALVGWRLGMAHVAPFVATLDPFERAGLIEDAITRLGEDWPPLVRSILVLTALA